MNKNILLIICIILVIVVGIFIISTAYINTENTEFKRMNLSATCSLEVPNIHFNIENSSFTGNYGDYNSITTGKILTSDKVIISYTKTTDNIGPLTTGTENMENTLNFNNVNIYSRTVFNYDTQETIHIQGEDKELVDHIADSVQFSTGNPQEVNSTNEETSRNNLKIIAYDIDGNPIYEGHEPWIWVDSTGVKHWSPEHQRLAESSYYDNDYDYNYEPDYDYSEDYYYPESAPVEDVVATT